MNDIKIFKLINGDEIIAEVVSHNVGSNWKLRKIRMIILQEVQQGRVGLGLLPWLASNVNGEFELHSTSLAGLPYDPEDDLQKAYLQQTTGITLAK